MEAMEIAIDLNSREYPDVTACALLELRRVEMLRKQPGYAGARHCGHGPQHVALRNLGLVTFERCTCTGAYFVDLTELGRRVAHNLAGIRAGIARPDYFDWR